MFEQYPRFLDTSETAATRHRLNLRHEAIIDANRDILSGARVLDLASHDGRWSFAALEAGAKHVTGVEARRKLVDNAQETFAHYGADPDSYRFICGDLFDTLAQKSFEVDVVLCLGFMYHTLRYPELFAAIRRIQPSHFVVDTKVATEQEPLIKLVVNKTRVQSNAAPDAYSTKGKALAGWPSVPALELMLDTYGFELEDMYDWRAPLARNPGEKGLKDYATGQRVTVRCRRTPHS